MSKASNTVITPEVYRAALSRGEARYWFIGGCEWGIRRPPGLNFTFQVYVEENLDEALVDNHPYRYDPQWRFTFR